MPIAPTAAWRVSPPDSPISTLAWAACSPQISLSSPVVPRWERPRSPPTSPITWHGIIARTRIQKMRLMAPWSVSSRLNVGRAARDPHYLGAGPYSLRAHPPRPHRIRRVRPHRRGEPGAPESPSLYRSDRRHHGGTACSTRAAAEAATQYRPHRHRLSPASVRLLEAGRGRPRAGGLGDHDGAESPGQRTARSAPGAL